MLQAIHASLTPGQMKNQEISLHPFFQSTNVYVGLPLTFDSLAKRT